MAPLLLVALPGSQDQVQEAGVAGVELLAAHAAGELGATALAVDDAGLTQDAVVLRAGGLGHGALQAARGLHAVQALLGFAKLGDDAETHRI